MKNSKTKKPTSLFKLLRIGDEYATDFINHPSAENGRRYIENRMELDRRCNSPIKYFVRNKATD